MGFLELTELDTDIPVYINNDAIAYFQKHNFLRKIPNNFKQEKLEGTLIGLKNGVILRVKESICVIIPKLNAIANK